MGNTCFADPPTGTTCQLTSNGVKDGIRYTQHVYGRFGQGKLAMLPWRSDATITVGSVAGKRLHTKRTCVGTTEDTVYWPVAPAEGTASPTVASAAEKTAKTDVAKIPYAYSEQATADRNALAHGIMISIFPQELDPSSGANSPNHVDNLAGVSDAATGADFKRITITASIQAWITNSNLVAPLQPVGAVDPNDAGAKMIMVGSAALAGIALSLY